MRTPLPAILITLALLLSHIATAQERHCPTIFEQGRDNPEIQKKNDAFEAWIQEQVIKRRTRKQQGLLKEEVITLPVVVHIIHNGENPGEGSNLSDEQVASQIAVLNEDFARSNADTVLTRDMFADVAANVEIQFALALQDPLGLPTTGIVRTEGFKEVYPISDADRIKALSYWPADDYINIWVAPLEFPNLGLAQFPLSNLPQLENLIDPIAETDGLLISYQFFGSSAKGNFEELLAPYDLGRTVTHEMGHFLGLRHIWGDGGCTIDDGCADTPASSDPHLGCETEAFLCGSLDMIENYMDLTDDACMNMFTQCQKERMRVVIENSPRRKSLTSSAALAAPVQVPNDLALIRFTEPETATCNTIIQPTVTVANHGTNVITSFQVRLSIYGFAEETAIVNDVNLAPGGRMNVGFSLRRVRGTVHPFEATVTQVNGVSDGNDLNNTIGITTFIPQPRFGSFTETFETILSDWLVRNEDAGAGWEQATAPKDDAANIAMRLSGFSNTNLGDIDILTSPVLEFNDVEEAILDFDFAYSNDSEDYPEGLIIAISTDCGATFPQQDWIFTRFSEGLITSSDASDGSEFIPNGPEDWRSQTLFLNRYINTSDIVIGFIGLNGNGNHLYLDNVQITATKTYNNNIKVQEILQPSFVLCDGDFSPQVEVLNSGAFPAYNFTVTGFINDNLHEEITYTDTLLPGQSAIIDFEALSLPVAQHEWITEANLLNGLDENPADDIAYTYFLINGLTRQPPLREEVPSTDLNELQWTALETFSNLRWEVTEAPGYGQEGNLAWSVNAYQNGIDGERIRLISPLIDLSNISEASLHFQTSYAADFFSRDRLRVLASRNCGNEPDIELFNRDRFLLAYSDTLDPWVPSEKDHWQRQYIDLEELLGETEVRLILEFENRLGNNIYVDDLEIFLSDTRRPANRFARQYDLNMLIWPNPSEEPTFNVTFDLDEKQDLTIEILDVTGRPLTYEEFPNTLNQTYLLDLGHRENGIYLLRITGRDFVTTRKVRVQY